MSAGSALAAAPTNDVSSSPVAIGTLPFTTTIDTSEATTDADDAALNGQCGAPATDASVWFTVTPTKDGDLFADVSGSDFTAGVIVAQGTGGSATFVSCGAQGTGWTAVAGETYTILAFDDQTDGGGNGGSLALTVDAAPTLDLVATVDHTARFDRKTGSAYVSGTVTCPADAESAFVNVGLTQRVGRLLISGSGSTDVACTGEPESWTVLVVGDNGIFKGGKAASVTSAFACGALACGEYFDEQTVQLKGRTR
jgi:hypothetical protein